MDEIELYYNIVILSLFFAYKFLEGVNMKEVCLINKGENLKKITFTLGINFKKDPIENVILNDKKCIVLKDGEDDIIVVKNYHPHYIKKMSSNETMIDIYAMGYDVIGGEESHNNCVILHRSQGIKYSVRPLERLEDIAERFGVEQDYIIETNSLRTEKLFVGQILII